MPAGFRAGGIVAGIKASGRPDLAVIAVTADDPAAAAAVFTPNTFAAAPVRLSREHLASTSGDRRGGFGWAKAVVSTSGSANAATGQAGDADQRAIASLVADGRRDHPRADAPPFDRGHRHATPARRVAAGLATLVPILEPSDGALEATAIALRTTDSMTKLATTTVTLPDADGRSVTVTVSGIAKGVGMIHPRMATMLAVVATDATAAPETLWGLLRPAAARTWDQLSVDGDTSTNDTVFLLASGAAGAAPVRDGSDEAATLGQAIEAVARDLARQQAADGEGATTLITAVVTGAADDADARAVARAVVSSSLVKAAAHGHDPNWGRIAGAAGNGRLADAAVLEAAGLPHEESARRAGTAARLDPALLRIDIAGHRVFDGTDGGPIAFDRVAARESMDGARDRDRAGPGAGHGHRRGLRLRPDRDLRHREQRVHHVSELRRGGWATPDV